MRKCICEYFQNLNLLISLNISWFTYFRYHTRFHWEIRHENASIRRNHNSVFLVFLTVYCNWFRNIWISCIVFLFYWLTSFEVSICNWTNKPLPSSLLNHDAFLVFWLALGCRKPLGCCQHLIAAYWYKEHNELNRIQSIWDIVHCLYQICLSFVISSTEICVLKYLDFEIM